MFKLSQKKFNSFIRFIFLSLCFCLSHNSQGQNFNAFTSRIFFGVNLKKSDKTIISDFTARPELTLKQDTGWTMYPPTDGKGNFIPYYDFSFTSNPYFGTQFTSGVVSIMMSADSSKFLGATLSMGFDSKPVFDSIYRSLKKAYSNYSIKIIKRAVAQPFEVTKYISKAGDFIIITKGEDNKKKPYIHIAYNFQDYRW